VKSSARSETPPLLAQYYDRKGDIGIFRERLQELEYHYQEELDERDIAIERGDPLDVSEEQFNKNYELQREAIIFDLTQAENDAQTLAQRCRAEGLEITERRPDSSEEAALSPLQALPDAREVQMSAKHRPDSSASTTSGDYLSPRGRIRVRGWLATLSDPGTPALPAEDLANIEADETLAQRGHSMELDATDTALSPVIPTGNSRRRAATYPQSPRRAVDSTSRPSISRIRAPIGRIQQKEITEFELVPDRIERDTMSLPEGEDSIDKRAARPPLQRFLSLFGL
jgi:hypothetical protein